MNTSLRAVTRSLPGLRPSATSAPELPHLTLARSAVAEPGHVAAYAEVCGFAPRDTQRDTVPVTYPHVLAFPLHLALMTDGDFPFPVLGTVHVDNAITQHRPVLIGEALVLQARAEALRPHPRGTAFDIVAVARVGGERVWTGRSTYLRRGPRDDTAPAGPAYDEGTPGGVPWRLPGDLGRRYARVSGDRNPIHLSVVTARMFGFRRPIAHGMWSLARCVAALENRLPDAVTLEVGFRRPVSLPGTVFLGDGGRQRCDFGLYDATGRAHLLGRASPADHPHHEEAR